MSENATERIFRLLQFLIANECTRKEIFEHLARYYKLDSEMPAESIASRSAAGKMLERDIQFLEGQGFEIKKNKVGGQPTSYSLVRESGPRATFIFTRAEVDSLALLYTIFADPDRYTPADSTQPLPLQPPHNPFAEDVLSLIEKLVVTLPPKSKAHFDRWVRKPFVYFNLSTVADYLPYRAVIDIIARAISDRQQIQFEYTPTRRKQESISHNDIDPYYVIYMEGHFYLIGYSHKMGQFLEYRIDRIKVESLKEQPNMIDVEKRRNPITFRFWIDGSIAKWGLSQRWLTQTIEREETFLDEQGCEQRRALVCATTYNEWRIIQQLLRYGDKVELVEPERLRARMRETVRRMQTFYED